jgi:tRNA threonylcarbamoyladenosine biosynthesis protein TsaB
MSAPPTGPVLALDSSTALGSVAVGDPAGLRAEITVSMAGGHSAALLPAVDHALRAAGLSPAELAAVVVSAGPGSFTGLRIAAATAKGIVAARGLPLYAYSGLLATAAGAWGCDTPVCALFDARKRDVYAACYRIGKRESPPPSPPPRGRGNSGSDPAGPAVPSSLFPVPSAVVEELWGPVALSLDEVLERFQGGEPPLFVGDAALLHRAELEERLGATVAPAHLGGGPRGAALLRLAFAAPALGAVADPAAWEPDYVRASGAERIAAARAAAEGGR